MTAEQKAKAYDEALKVLHKYDGANIMFTQDLKEEMFPELKESEDERIRKAITEFFKNFSKTGTWNAIPNVAKWIAWLEDQGKHKKFRDSIQVGDKVTKNEDGVLVNLSQLKRVAKKDEKQGEQKPADYKNANIQQKDFAPKENTPRYSIGDVLCDKSCTMLNKESRHNFEITDIRDGMYICGKWSFPISHQDEYELVAKRIEQKPTDKVEPKFHKGDWIINNKHNNVAKVLEINNEEYRLDYCDTVGTISIALIDNDYHLWTIQDAKDGDVLCDSYSNTILIFKSQTCGWIKVHCDFWINKNKFTGTCSADYGRVSEMDLKPATKEQCDTLFAKMHEAGYVWDAEKKELKKIEQKSAMIQWKGNNLKEVIDFTGIYKDGFEKWFHNSWEEYEKYFHSHDNIFKLFNEDGSHIEVPVGAWIVKTPDGYNTASRYVFKQKPAWSEEDELMLMSIIQTLKLTNGAAQMKIDWLKSLKDRIQPKQEWSEEDKRKINDVIVALSEYANGNIPNIIPSILLERVAWLKSLSPQSHWKPSDEQMKALWNVYRGGKEQAELATLYNDLKRLLKI